MCAALYVVLESEDVDFDIEMDGTHLSVQADSISGIAERAGVKAPLHFVSSSAEDLEDLIGEVPEGFEESWFSPEEGVSWIKDLAAAVESNSSALSDLEAVRTDIARLTEILREAAKARIRWHLAVDA